MNIKKMITAIKDKLKHNKWILKLYIDSKHKIDRMRGGVFGKGNNIEKKGILYNVTFDIRGNNNHVLIKSSSVLYNMKFHIRGNNHKVVIEHNCEYKGGSIWIENDSSEVLIGKGTTIEDAHLVAIEGAKIVIGEDCMFASQIEIRTGDSHTIIDRNTCKRINPSKDVNIGNHVWIGTSSVVLKGVTIGYHSVIGTNTVVTKDIPSHSLVVGIPAKVIKQDVDWSRQRL